MPWLLSPARFDCAHQPTPPDLIIYHSIKFAQLDSNPSVRWCRTHWEPLEIKKLSLS